MGGALQEEGRLAEAREHYEKAARLEPSSGAAQLHLGGVYAEAGQLAEAEAAFRAALRLQPRSGPAPCPARRDCSATSCPTADRAAIEQRLADPRLRPGPRARLLFGLAHVLDARGEYDRAADCLREANALTLESVAGSREYRPAEHALHVDGLLQVVRCRVLRRTAGMGLETRRPVFIFGLPRSGTTLVEQVLASHPRVHGAGELRLGRRSFEAIPAVLGRRERPMECVPHLDAGALRRLAERHLEQLALHDGGRAERIVDKMPDNYLYLGLLAAMFPGATFIHCRRDLRDVAVSCWMTDFRSIRWANDPGHIASRLPRIPPPDGPLAGRPAGPRPRGRLRGDRRRPGRRRAAAAGGVRPGVGPGLPGIPPHRAHGPHGQRHPGPPADLHDLRRPLEALRSGAGRPVRGVAGPDRGAGITGLMIAAAEASSRRAASQRK